MYVFVHVIIITIIWLFDYKYQGYKDVSHRYKDVSHRYKDDTSSKRDANPSTL